MNDTPKLGHLVLRLQPNESILIGDEVRISLSGSQGIDQNGNPRTVKPTRILFEAPDYVKIERCDEFGNPMKRVRKNRGNV